MTIRLCSTRIKCNAEQRRFLLEKWFADNGYHSYVEAAKACGISKSYFSRLISGKRSLGTKDRPRGRSKLVAGVKRETDGKRNLPDDKSYNELLLKFGITEEGAKWMEADVGKCLAKDEVESNVPDVSNEEDTWRKEVAKWIEQGQRLLDRKQQNFTDGLP